MKAWSISLAFVVALLCSVSPALAVSFVSTSGLDYTSGVVVDNLAGTEELDNIHSAWEPNDPLGTGAVWISYAQTGNSNATDIVAPFGGGATTPVMSLLLSFNLDFDSILNFKVWADDTARVTISGYAPFAQQSGQATCADVPVGCEPNEGQAFTNLFWGAGLQTIQLDFYQVGTGTTPAQNPFGALFYGSHEPAVVPEPASMVLLGTGLMGLAAAARRRRQPKA